MFKAHTLQEPMKLTTFAFSSLSFATLRPQAESCAAGPLQGCLQTEWSDMEGKKCLASR